MDSTNTMLVVLHRSIILPVAMDGYCANPNIRSIEGASFHCRHCLIFFPDEDETPCIATSVQVHHIYPHPAKRKELGSSGRSTILFLLTKPAYYLPKLMAATQAGRKICADVCAPIGPIEAKMSQ